MNNNSLNCFCCFVKDEIDTHGTYDKKHNRYIIPISGQYSIIRNNIAFTDWYNAGDALYKITACYLITVGRGPRTIHIDFVNVDTGFDSKPIGGFNND